MTPDLARLLSLSLVRVRVDGRWPRIVDLERDQARNGDDTKLEPAARDAPPELGRLGENGVFHPTVEGLAAVVDSWRDEPILVDFMAATRLATERVLEKRRARGRRSILTLGTLRRELGLGRKASRVLAQVLQAEGGIFECEAGRRRGPLGRRWRCRISHQAARLVNVHSLEGYLALRAGLTPAIGDHSKTASPPVTRSEVTRGLGRFLRDAAAAAAGGAAVVLFLSPQPVAEPQVVVVQVTPATKTAQDALLIQSSALPNDYLDGG